MTRMINADIDRLRLRSMAKAAAGGNIPNILNLSREDIQRLLFDHCVYQLELEAQIKQLSESLLEVERLKARYQDFFDKAPVGFLVLNDEGRIQTSNPALCALLAVKSQNLIGNTFAAFVKEENLPAYLQHLRDTQEASNRTFA